MLSCMMGKERGIIPLRERRSGYSSVVDDRSQRALSAGDKAVMRLSDIVETYIGKDCTVAGLSCDSRGIEQNYVYFAIRGIRVDGEDYIGDAIDRGATVVVSDRFDSKIEATQVVVDNVRRAMATIAAKFYGNAYKKLKLIGITGTNGKTTTSYVLQSILQSYDKRVAIIGSNGVLVHGQRIDSVLTTPDPIQLHEVFARLVDINVEYVVMEVSAHALALDKVFGLKFETVVFSNFSRDHLDFFGTIQSYKKAKLKLFGPEYSRCAVVNIDDSVGVEIAVNSDLPIVTYGNTRPADVFAVNFDMTLHGLSYMVNCMDNIGHVEFGIPGRFNMYNTLAAIACAHTIGIPIKNTIEGIKSVNKVDGRFDVISTGRLTVVVDYAHTDEGLQNLLSTVHELCENKIITIFGCGGDRDSTKRSLMGVVAAQMSDVVIVTSDNPRSEDPLSIISQIEEGVKTQSGVYYECIADRKQAIARGLQLAQLGDIVVIAGKGAENTQEIGGVLHLHNDYDYVLSIME